MITMKKNNMTVIVPSVMEKQYIKNGYKVLKRDERVITPPPKENNGGNDNEKNGIIEPPNGNDDGGNGENLPNMGTAVMPTLKELRKYSEDEVKAFAELNGINVLDCHSKNEAVNLIAERLELK